MNNIDLKTILEKHKMWLNDEDGGEMADLREANLRGADLYEANLREADLRFVMLGKEAQKDGSTTD